MHLSRRQLLQIASGVGLSTALSACGHKLGTATPTGSAGSTPRPLPASTASAGTASAGTASAGSASAGTASAGTASISTTPVASAGLSGLASLSGGLSRPLVLPNSPGYAGASRLYNPRFDTSSRPAAVAQCQSAADVAACVRYAAGSGTALHLRSGGHSYGGWSTGPGLVVDVSGLSSVKVDSATRTARIGAGATLINVYSAVAAQGFALAAGSCPTVGITGLTLGGGIGVLSRAFGLTCDAIRSVQIVTADGRLREVTARSDADLFWALKGGGGGSFGAVTAFTMELRPAPQVHTFFLQWPYEEAETVLTAWQRWVASADPRLWSTCKLLVDPPSGSRQLTVSGTWIGAASALASQLAPLRAAISRPPLTDQAGTLSYAQAMLAEAGCSGQTSTQCSLAALSPAKRLPFAATSAILGAALPPAGIAAAARAVQDGAGIANLVEGGVSFDALGGQVNAVPASGSAFAYRSALAMVQYTATWASMASAPAPFDTYVRRLRATLLPWTGASAYVSYADPKIGNYGRAYWAGNYPRLQSVKKQYDPGALFDFPQAVRG